MHPPHPAASQINIIASSSSLVSHGSDASVNSISQHIRLTGKLWDRRLRGNLPLILIVNSFIKVVPLYDTTEAAFFLFFPFCDFIHLWLGFCGTTVQNKCFSVQDTTRQHITDPHQGGGRCSKLHAHARRRRQQGKCAKPTLPFTQTADTTVTPGSVQWCRNLWQMLKFAWQGGVAAIRHIGIHASCLGGMYCGWEQPVFFFGPFLPVTLSQHRLPLDIFWSGSFTSSIYSTAVCYKDEDWLTKGGNSTLEKSYN